MIIDGVVEALIGIDAEGKPLEAVASAHRGWLG